jgi:hypothetical protein
MTFWGVLGKVKVKIAEKSFERTENARRNHFPAGVMRTIPFVLMKLSAAV